MQTDRYTKAVLTVIAVALCAIALQGSIRPASAIGGEGCGSTFNPCQVEIGNSPLNVRVSNKALDVMVIGPVEVIR
jgi:hypothetical protein